MTRRTIALSFIAALASAAGQHDAHARYLRLLVMACGGGVA